MGCCGDREKNEVVANEQRWDYINLSDFRSSSCWAGFSYGFLYIALIVSVACYVVDVYTAFNLLFFNKWNGAVKPTIPFDVSKWIFSGCIILSWLLLVYRWWRALRAIRSGGIANSFLDPLAVRVQSIRMGKTGRGWRRFLVFTELTKSKKGTEYIALFTYFSFEAWLRIIFAEGPRNAINAVTLYAVMQADLLVQGNHAAAPGTSSIAQFFINVKILAEGNRNQAAILFGMLFTLVIWVIALLSLMVAAVLYVMFLWHHIPRQDGGLAGYCKRKIDRSVTKIVSAKVKKALEKEQKKQEKAYLKAAAEGKEGEFGGIKRQPTLPVLDDDKLPQMPGMHSHSRRTSVSSLPPYQTRPNTAHDNPMPELGRQPTLPNVPMDFRPMPARSATQHSNASYASNAPLMGGASAMGYDEPGRSYSPAPSQMGQDRPYTPNGKRPFGPPIRVNTNTSNYSGNNRSNTPFSQAVTMNDFPLRGASSTPGMPSRQNTNATQFSSSTLPRGPPTRANTGFSDMTYTNPEGPGPQRHITNASTWSMNSSVSNFSRAAPSMGGRSTPAQAGPMDPYGRRTPGPMPAQAHEEYEMRSQTPQSAAYRAYTPALAPGLAPGRNFTSSPPQIPQSQGDYFQQRPPQRSGTAPVPLNVYNQGYDDRDGMPRTLQPPTRAATASPGSFNRF